MVSVQNAQKSYILIFIRTSKNPGPEGLLVLLQYSRYTFSGFTPAARSLPVFIFLFYCFSRNVAVQNIELKLLDCPFGRNYGYGNNNNSNPLATDCIGSNEI